MGCSSVMLPCPFRGGQRGQYAPQDVDLVPVRLGAREQPAQPPHQVARVVRVEEAAGEQQFLQVAVEVLHLAGGSGPPLPGRRLADGRTLHLHLIGHHLYRHGQVQRAEIRRRGDVQQRLATGQVVVAQPRFLGAEDQCHRSRRGFRHGLVRGLPRAQFGPGDAALAGTGARHPDTVGHGLLQRGGHPCAVQQVLRPRSTGAGFLVGKTPGRHQHQVPQTHVLHGPRRGADVAGVGGAHQYDTDSHGPSFVSLLIRSAILPPALIHPATGYDSRMQPLANIAAMAARKGGDMLLRQLNQLDRLKVETKGRNDFVSEADRQAEAVIVDTILNHYPDHAILAEEGGARGESDHLWIIDPLDGTTNFLHGFPVFCVSVGLQIRGRLEHGVIYDPLRQEMFTASRGEGAQLDGRRIRVTNRRDLADALIGTGFPYRRGTAGLDPYMALLKDVIRTSAGVRRPGAAALDLAYVAAGRLDGFWETGLKPWDLAAGALLIREAGGIISGLDGSEGFMETGHVLAGSPKIYAALARLTAPHLDGLLA